MGKVSKPYLRGQGSLVRSQFKSQKEEKQSIPDYIEFIAQPLASKYVSDIITHGRRIALYGINMAVIQQLDGRVEIDPVIPALGQLIRLIGKHEQFVAFKWNRKSRQWTLGGQVSTGRKQDVGE